MGHGRADQVVQFPWGETSYKFLKEKLEMPNVEFHAYKGRSLRFPSCFRSERSFT